jgi:NADPH-dependent 2,4-dienoyl-CoA reductase/sulfur reductase-like enzyme
MTQPRLNRRQMLGTMGAGAASTLLPAPALAQSAPRVVIIGGGFAGATIARALKAGEASIEVTLIEANRTFTACPLSNLVIAGLRDLAAQRFAYDKVAAAGIKVAFAVASRVDAKARTVALANGATLAYDRLILAPGIDIRWHGLPGYDEAAATRMPHAWKAGEQTVLLRRQLEAMEDGGVVVLAVPAGPIRCPPAPYERASLIAAYLKSRKPRSKLLVLDAKDAFTRQRLFEAAWRERYPHHLEWIALSQGGNVTSVDSTRMALITDFETYTAAVANVVPPQQAGRIAELAGVADSSGWCPIDPLTFESRLVPHVHVLGDAAITEAMPKSAVAANSQAKICAAAVLKLLAGEPPAPPTLATTCYALAAPDYAIEITGIYRSRDGVLLEVPADAGASPPEARRAEPAQLAVLAERWFTGLTQEVFG